LPVIGVARDSLVEPWRRDAKNVCIHVLEDEEWR
jgi:hypothetical protein